MYSVSAGMCSSMVVQALFAFAHLGSFVDVQYFSGVRMHWKKGNLQNKRFSLATPVV